MTRRLDVEIPLSAMPVVDVHDGSSVDLGGLRGVHVLVLMRHRH